MMDAYYQLGLEQTAVFEFYVRRLPDTRNFLVAAGLEQALDYLEALRFTPAEIAWVESSGHFSPGFASRLEKFRFTGDVFAMREGTVFFASEPILRVEAPLPEAQFVESRLVNLLHYQTLVASKAVRCRIAAGQKQLVDFGMRRAHGAEAAVLAARACHIAGFDATATVEAARLFGIPVVGTMAHSYVQAHELEAEAFRSFARCHPGNLTLLIDTYDTARAAGRAAKLATELRAQGVEVMGVRIDSGDLGAEARKVRRVLDEAGCNNVRILVSGGLDEYGIAELLRLEAPVDIFCTGTRISVSDDVPALDCAYKLHQYAGRACRKRSPWKETWPGPRQVHRQYDSHGLMTMDVLSCADEAVEGQALLQSVMVKGRRAFSAPALAEVRRHCHEELAKLPPAFRTLEKSPRFHVDVTGRQHALAASVDRNPT
jgi:nicotinate phosphoribosyltransferase